MINTNVNLSKEEMEAVTNPEWILTKNRIIDKVIVQFETLAGQYQKLVGSSSNIRAEISLVPPKISKGEKYLGLPYIMLDYPRIFTRDDVFAVRSFFWWGNFFSITLHLSGKYKSCLNINSLKAADGWNVATGSDEWSHDLNSEHYKILAEDFSNLEAQTFIKLAKKIPLEQWDFSTKFFIENFEKIITSLITAQPVK